MTWRRNADSQQHATCSPLHVLYLIATPSFCLFSSLSIPPFLHHSLPPPRPAGADGDCKARWRIPASQSVSACCSPVRGGEGWGDEAAAFPTLSAAYARQLVGEIKISGTAKSGSMSTETDRQTGNNCWGELMSWECICLLQSSPRQQRPNGELNLHHCKHVYLYPSALWWRVEKTLKPVQSI